MKILANLEKGMKSFGDYCVPMNSTFTLNVERIPALDDAVRSRLLRWMLPRLMWRMWVTMLLLGMCLRLMGSSCLRP